MDGVVHKPLREADLAKALASTVKCQTQEDQSLLLFDDRALADFDSALRSRIISDWRIGSTKSVSRLKSLLQAKSFQSLQKLVHGLQGSSSQIGALRLADRFKYLEQEAASATPDVRRLSGLVATAMSLFERTLELLP
jgi:hypothetical protein